MGTRLLLLLSLRLSSRMEKMVALLDRRFEEMRWFARAGLFWMFGDGGSLGMT
jgi:hypothetical protein